MDTGVQTIDNDSEQSTAEAQIHQTFVTLQGFPRKKLTSASEAHKKFVRAILEASAELTHDFHTAYLQKVVNGNIGKEFLEVKNPVSSYETLKKGFLHFLNGSGKYLVLREHLREAVTGLLHQKSLISHVNGFKTRQQYQNFLHDSYGYMLDTMNEALYSTSFEESEGVAISKCGIPGSELQKEIRKARHMHDLLLFAQEAIAQSDYENAHRIHVERVASSGDSDKCWIDFAVMWLSRGDDRLAEIAVREALTKNPDNLVGLLLAGLIAGSHRDEHAVSYFETLLRFRPLCPEIHVLLGLVHSYMGNNNEAESFYRTARKLHSILTIVTITLRNQSIPNEEVPQSPPKIEELKPDTGGAGDKVKKGKKGQSSEPENSKEKDKRKSSGGSAISRKSKDSKKEKGSGNESGENTSNITGSKGSKKSDAKNSAGSYDGIEDVAGVSEDKMEYWGIKITKGNVIATKPPKLGSCLVVTWNVTKKPRQGLAHPEFGYRNQYAPSIGETTEQIQAQFNSALKADSQKQNRIETPTSEPHPSHQTHTHNQEGHVQETVTFDQTHQTQIHTHHGHAHHHHKHRHHKNPPITEPRHYSIFDVDQLLNPKGKGAEEYGESYEEGKIQTPPPSASDLPPASEGLGLSEEKPRSSGNFAGDHNIGSVSEEEPVYSQRVGSELLWTAHLLLKLRQFEFLDLILALEISKSTVRSAEYLYLRAASLHLRGRDQEALEILKEALDLQPENGILWTLMGHAHYNLREKESALACYERAMMLPHGRESLHLAYLRLGILCIDKGDPQLAKRIFLKRVSISPSPYLWIAIGTTCYQLGELEEALNAFSEANKMDSSNPIIWAHLSLVSLAQGNRTLAEQAYKWAIRFGLKSGKLMDEIKDLHRKLGYGNPAFPKIPHCVPHDVFVQRIGREKPLELYADALNFSHLNRQPQRNKFDNTESEEALIHRLIVNDSEREARENAALASSGRRSQAFGRILLGKSRVSFNAKKSFSKKSLKKQTSKTSNPSSKEKKTKKSKMKI